jgi:hypothetical protein
MCPQELCCFTIIKENDSFKPVNVRMLLPVFKGKELSVGVGGGKLPRTKISFTPQWKPEIAQSS